MVMTMRPHGSRLGRALGVTAVLLPGDPDAAWDYVERQVADLAAKLDVPVEEVSHGGGELLWVEMPDPRERLKEPRVGLEDAFGDAGLPETMAGMMVDNSVLGAWPMTWAVDRASRPAGQAISSSRASARPTSRDHRRCRRDSRFACRFRGSAAGCRRAPGETLSFTYLDGAAISGRSRGR